jgi:hypothetical protein
MEGIADEVRARAFEMVHDVAMGIHDTTPFGKPPPAPPQLKLEDYLTAPPEARQAMLQGLPPEEFGSTMSRLQSEAVDRFGAMAQAIMPMLNMEEAQGQLAFAQQQDPALGVQAAHQDLIDILGSDPFA